ncbi:hypothetical protein N5923_21265 [Erwiniaceae bacterium BAC15a-03b]|uniref:Uncharacterized protein n=1 Tax=Winslowiella arboricola TaxID=2978220 RepID=A0A9J6PX12_9GAMM|nr:hypothetical protein [Winslowiella arboricola]MCU5774824.1 hypothetical protein [Winslowiella arboricola]MCU5780024.1 hypothetical protein [Winslowiella arboricola]
MIQIITLTGKKRPFLPVPEWFSKPVSGEEAMKRAKAYDERMELVSQGRELSTLAK